MLQLNYGLNINMIETLYQLQCAIYTNNFPLKLMACEKNFNIVLCNKQSQLRSLRHILHTASATIREVSPSLIR